MNRLLLLGGSGVLGSEVLYRLQLIDVDYVAPPSSDLDIRDKLKLQNFVREFKPNWIINCTAWTNVDAAEDSFQAALELNEGAVRNIVEAARDSIARLFIFLLIMSLTAHPPNHMMKTIKLNP